MNCPKCGLQVSDETNICPRCGEALKPAQAPAPQSRRVPNIPRRAQDPLPERPAKSQRSGGLSGCLSAVLLCAGICVILAVILI